VGSAGSWLIDPFNVTIAHGVATGSLTGNPFDPMATSTIQDGDINAALDKGTSVTITTGTGGSRSLGDITFEREGRGQHQLRTNRRRTAHLPARCQPRHRGDAGNQIQSTAARSTWCSTPVNNGARPGRRADQLQRRRSTPTAATSR
jgi:hypothetical protein